MILIINDYHVIMCNSLPLSENKFNLACLLIMQQLVISFGLYWSNHDHAFCEPAIVEPKTSGCHHHVLMLRRRGRTSELAGSGTSGASQNISQRHHSVTNIQANNLLGTHDLNTRLRVGNSSVNLYFRHEVKLNLLVIRHEFAFDSLIVRHEFTKTRLWLGMSLQKLSFH